MAKKRSAKTGKRPPPQEPSGFVRLRNACLYDLEEARRMVLAEPELLEARNGTGETALHWLAIENQLEAVAALNEWGANADSEDKFQSTPLIHCVVLGHPALVSLLLSQGARVTHQDHVGQSAISAAARRKKPEILQLALPALPPGYDINSLFDDWDANEVLDRGDEVSALLAARGLKRREI